MISKPSASHPVLWRLSTPNSAIEEPIALRRGAEFLALALPPRGLANGFQRGARNSLNLPAEVEQIKDRYARRAMAARDGRYDLLNSAVYMTVQERERALLRWIRQSRLAPLASRRLLEVGCGSGVNLLDFLRFGFLPENLIGNELLPERIEAARRVLPSGLRIVPGDAIELQFPEESFDVVYQSTVFTSILDRDFQRVMAARMWSWVKPGGGVLWYDFIYDNPRNSDVASVPLRRIRELFPDGDLQYWRLTLAPPLARLVTRVHPTLYNLVNALPLLRTHVLCWIRKERRSPIMAARPDNRGAISGRPLCTRISLVFIGQQNVFSEFLVNWLARTTTLTGVIWTASERHSWRAKLKRLGRRVRIRGVIRAAAEMLWFLAAKVLYFHDGRDLTRRLESLRVAWDLEPCGVPCVSVPSLQSPEAVEFLHRHQPNLLLAQCINEIIQPDVFNFPALGCYILHDGIVPQYRGKFCAHWAIRNGDFHSIGASLIRVQRGIDRGPVAFAERVFPEARGRGPGWLEHEVVLLALPRLKAWLKGVALGDLQLSEQTETHPLYSYPTIGHLLGYRHLKAAYERWALSEKAAERSQSTVSPKP